MDVLVVGLGTVAATHLKVLGDIDGVHVIGGIDPKPRQEMTFRSRPLRVFGSIASYPAGNDPELVVVATPTSTHAAVGAEVMARFPRARVLVEKPAADNLEDVCALLRPADGRAPVTVAYHLAFSAEVLWGAEQAIKRVDEIGEPEQFEQLFCDPYGAHAATMAARLGTSWIDSGINAMSILQRFAEPVERTDLRALDPLVFEAHVRCRTTRGADASAMIMTSWRVGSQSRTTRVTFASGAHLVLDHIGVAGYLFRDGRIQAMHGSDSSVSRAYQRYRALYRSLLGDAAMIYDTETSLRLSRLLLRG